MVASALVSAALNAGVPLASGRRLAMLASSSSSSSSSSSDDDGEFSSDSYIGGEPVCAAPPAPEQENACPDGNDCSAATEGGGHGQAKQPLAPRFNAVAAGSPSTPSEPRRRGAAGSTSPDRLLRSGETPTPPRSRPSRSIAEEAEARDAMAAADAQAQLAATTRRLASAEAELERSVESAQLADERMAERMAELEAEVALAREAAAAAEDARARALEENHLDAATQAAAAERAAEKAAERVATERATVKATVKAAARAAEAAEARAQEAETRAQLKLKNAAAEREAMHATLEARDEEIGRLREEAVTRAEATTAREAQLESELAGAWEAAKEEAKQAEEAAKQAEEAEARWAEALAQSRQELSEAQARLGEAHQELEEANGSLSQSREAIAVGEREWELLEASRVRTADPNPRPSSERGSTKSAAAPCCQGVLPRGAKAC